MAIETRGITIPTGGGGQVPAKIEVNTNTGESKLLSSDGFTVNVTLCFSVAQAILASKAGATYISPFVGRVDDNSFDGLGLVKDIAKLYREHLSRTQVLAASLRNVKDVADCFSVGADVVTMPPAIFGKMYNHILTDKGLQLFQDDWNSIKKD